MKACILLCATLLSFSALAQDYKPFKVNLSVGKASISGRTTGGYLVSLEPRFGTSNFFDLGVRVEAAGAQRTLEVNGQYQKAEGKLFGSGLLTGNFYLSGRGVRPYVGAGVGFFHYGSVIFDNIPNNENVSFNPVTHFGSMIRAGLKIGHLNGGIEYNLVAPTRYTIMGQTLKASNNYLGLKIGLDLGGGRK